MKKSEKFFNGVISDYYAKRGSLYIGDMDFKFANEFYVINAEIKTISEDGMFKGKKLSFLQAREMSATAGLIDPIGRKHSNYLFEYHKYAKDPFIVITPFKTITGKERTASEFLNHYDRVMVYVEKDNQFALWLDKFNVGREPSKPLLCADGPLPF